MLKNISNLGAQQLSVSEQKAIKGGIGENCYHAAINEEGVVVCQIGYSFRVIRGKAYCCPN
jgi:nitrate reductase alpha subunit